MKAFGLNRGDLIQREGKYPMPPGTPKELGLEFSGVVAGVGQNGDAEERQKWKLGDEVFGLVYGGAYAEYVVVSKTMLLAKPKELSWECCGGLCEVCRLLVNCTFTPPFHIRRGLLLLEVLCSPLKLMIALDPPQLGMAYGSANPPPSWLLRCKNYPFHSMACRYISRVDGWHPTFSIRQSP